MGQAHAVGNMGLDDPGALVWSQLVVDIPDPQLILDEAVRIRRLADIVVESTYLRHQRVGTDVLGCTLDHAAQDEAVIVRTGRPDTQATQKRLAGLSQLE